MADSSKASLVDGEPADQLTIICKSCDLTTTQAVGTRRRTICPHCGNFYAQEQGSNMVATLSHSAEIRIHSQKRIKSHRQNRQERLPSLDRSESEQRTGGALKSIANFFKNLGPKDRAKNGSRSDSPDVDTSQHSRTTQRSRSKLASSSTTQLPPIGTESTTMLTVDSVSVHGGTSPRVVSRMLSSHPSFTEIQMELGTTENQSIQQVLAKSIEDLRCDVIKAKETDNWTIVKDYYSIVFESSTNINATFKLDANAEYKTVEESGIDLPLVYEVYSILTNLPQDVHKVVLKSTINNLLKEKRLQTKDELRAYIILLLNPQFKSIPTYMIFAHLLRQIASLTDTNHHYLVHWCKRIHPSKFRELIVRLQRFISCRLYPPKPEDLPPMPKCFWWIPNATKVLALLNASSNLCYPPIVCYQEFYNSSLDLLDLLAEYYTWQNPTPHQRFSFCQYPFVLSIAAKRSILQRDSEQQMVVMARRSLVAKVQQRQLPDIGMLFLNLTVRRSHLVSDSLNEIARKKSELKKKLKVTFAGEPGLDMGGLTKEWFLLLIRQIFQPEYGMFTYDKIARSFWLSSAPCENFQEFNLVGVLMGLAVYNSIILDVRFPPVCYRKLLSPAVVPYNLPQATVGVAKVTLLDLKSVNPELARGLQELLDYDGDVEEDFGLTFQITYNELGSTTTKLLKPGGENIFVTNSNRNEYVQLYVDFMLNGSIYSQFQAFYHGFHSVCASNALIMLRPEEIELLVCGSPTLDMKELKRVTVYDGYTAESETIKFFWDIILSMPSELQKQVLLFTTGSDRIPVGGMKEMQFKITRVENVNMLPMSHTCFNQLVLPAYRTKKTLKQKLLVAIQNAEGFGLE